MTRYAIEGLVDGVWAREHVGAADETTLFDTRDEAERALVDLALTWDGEDDLRVVEVAKHTSREDARAYALRLLGVS